MRFLKILWFLTTFIMVFSLVGALIGTMFIFGTMFFDSATFKTWFFLFIAPVVTVVLSAFALDYIVKKQELLENNKKSIDDSSEETQEDEPTR